MFGLFLRKKECIVPYFRIRSNDAIYFHENSSAYAVGGIVARINAVHGINSIPAWDG